MQRSSQSTDQEERRSSAGSGKLKMSATMAASLAEIIDRGGKIIRHQGGWWTEPGATPKGIIGHPFDWWLGGSTVQALVRRGEIEYTEWKEGRGFRFPIAASVPALGADERSQAEEGK